jgi:hypothetical protein
VKLHGHLSNSRCAPSANFFRCAGDLGFSWAGPGRGTRSPLRVQCFIAQSSSPEVTSRAASRGSQIALYSGPVKSKPNASASSNTSSRVRPDEVARYDRASLRRSAPDSTAQTAAGAPPLRRGLLQELRQAHPLQFAIVRFAHDLIGISCAPLDRDRRTSCGASRREKLGSVPRRAYASGGAGRAVAASGAAPLLASLLSKTPADGRW